MESSQVHPFERPPRALFRVSAIRQCQVAARASSSRSRKHPRMPAPTSTTRLRLSPLQLLRITQSTLWQVLSHFGPDIQQRFVEALRDAHEMVGGGRDRCDDGPLASADQLRSLLRSRRLGLRSCWR